MTIMNQLVNDAGDIDVPMVIKAARARASREWGDDNFPPMYYRQALQFCHDRAKALRLDWRRQRGLPDDSETVMMDVAAWGASGDSYGAAR
jgi:hypothetical protein